MKSKLDSLLDRYKKLEGQMADPEILADLAKYQKVSKEHADLRELVAVYQEYHTLEADLGENQLLVEDDDADLAELAQAEVEAAEERLPELERQLRVLLLPKDPNDEKNVILEIRAGTGGEEAALFAADLLRMYLRFAELKRWKVEIMDSHETAGGGFKEVIANISGQGAYSQLKYESGVHRVQRVPATESQGRIHTSAVTVAVLPEAAEVEVDIKPEEIRVDVYRSSGPGGQSVNTTDSAVRITHLPTGLVVSIQDEKSQHKNKAKAMKVLRARLFEKMQSEAHEEQAAARKSQVGSGDRSERIRTYNFPQGRVTDHRIGLTLYKLEQVLNGEMDELIPQLIAFFQAEALGSELPG
ncbi:MAG: peptide chain release factor 1 [Deltaproteobacteria bacterium]|nr:peptide chain release factor 1 [Deltaproteobacteria bacterium]